MDNNIVQSVFDSLDADTTEIGKTVAEYEELETKIKDGYFGNQALKDEIYPKRDALKSKIRTDSANAMKKAKGLVEQYRQDAEKLNDLDPSAITDDIRLLQAGVALNARDINAILDRNKDNRTMTQLTLRYAKEHDIDVKTIYVGGQAEAETARNLDGIIGYYEKWIDKKDAKNILRKFFNVTEG